MRAADLWKWNGRIDRPTYMRVGLIGLAVKLVLDYLVVTLLFHRVWTPLIYWRPFGVLDHVRQLGGADAVYAASMLTLAFPFMWIGVSMTVRRLRDAGWPLGLACLFFVPMMNLALLGLLCFWQPGGLVIERQVLEGQSSFLDTWIPSSRWAGGVASISVTAMVGLALAVFGANVLLSYGWGVFVALPFCTGLLSVLIYTFHSHQTRTLNECLWVSIMPMVLVAVGVLFVAIEGIICILMAAPIGLALAAMGGYLGYAIQSARWGKRNSTAMLSLTLMITPSVFGLEQAMPPLPETFEVRSAIEVNASPGKVWQQVIAFSEIPAPEEWIFRAGVAYPVRAEIHGTGPGAIRYCMFSTGPFVEPIEVWDQPRLLRFGVTSNPPPMNELSPYGHIEPAHLHGYFESHKGQFLLTELPGGRTRIEGTTWYSHALWPQQYWHLWSDYIIHRIHMRVLRHIKTEAEQQ